MSWLPTLLTHSHLPGCTSSFLAPLPSPLPYPHPPPLPLPPYHHLVTPWAPVPLLLLVGVSPCCLRCGVNVCSCIGVVCVVARHLGGCIASLSIIYVVVCCQRCGIVIHCQHCGVVMCIVVCRLHPGSIVCSCVVIVVCIAAALSALLSALSSAALLSATLLSAPSLS